MVRKAAVSLLLVASANAAIAQEPALDPMDSVVWQFQSRTQSTYWIIAKDVTWQQGVEPVTFWMHGNHYADNTVKYRKSLHRITLNCEGSMRISALSKFASDGRTLESWDGYGKSEYIRPDSLGASLEKQFCGKK